MRQTLSVFLFLQVLSSAPVAARNLRSVGRLAPKEHFSEDQRQELTYCGDTPQEKFSVPDGNEEHDCRWLEENIEKKGYLCDFHQVSSTCRKTCGVCEDTIRAVELLSTCANEEGDVELLPETGVWINCDWLSDHETQRTESCSATSVALHCPVVCDTFHLGPCVAIDPLPDT
uniref:ShKT domain-containing protein n=1 Tax=Entomoneis paludosa TaxID=265537 RepID=A0A7S2YFH8_9STRA|mmetsp:Transcript_30705/g.64135  ORF Transcript_30705/g.64135 Transcript_30705/m.64135 type:complete len:173 (+) Transcript_30705:60-578(+)